MQVHKWQKFIDFIDNLEKNPLINLSFIMTSFMTNGAIINNAVKESIVRDIDTLLIVYLMLILKDLPMTNKLRGDYMEMVGVIFDKEDINMTDLENILKNSYNSFNQKHIFKNQLN